jgi:hypothetical protein
MPQQPGMTTDCPCLNILVAEADRPGRLRMVRPRTDHPAPIVDR